MAVIGIMDSGIGGLSVYKEIKKLLPNENYIYYADTAFCPYGEKDPKLIRQRLKAITDFMLSKGVEIMVLACNTATAAAINYLRDTYTIPFIGMEPAVKPAALGTKSGTIGVLATAGTLKGSKYLNTKGRYSSNIKIVENVGKGYVEIVEKAFENYPEFNESIINSEESIKTIEQSLKPLIEAGADTIVLGCTHYPFLLPVLQKIAGPNIRFINPAPAVASHLQEVIDEQALIKGTSYSFNFYTSL